MVSREKCHRGPLTYTILVLLGVFSSVFCEGFGVHMRFDACSVLRKPRHVTISALQYTSRQNHYINNSLRVILCNGRDLITLILCNDTEMTSSKIFYVTANLMNYTQNSSFPSAIS